MPNYGKYETARELSRGPLATVFVAHPSGKTGRDEFVVKAYVIGAHVADQDEAKGQAKRFLARVSAMEAITRAKARYWAPVLDQGEVSTGAFYATKRYPRSIDQLISGRVRLDAGSLYNIAWSIFQGLRECQQHAGRPHGALKATNVLLDRVGQVAAAKIVLTDPAPPDEIDPVSGELDDLRALGRLIYQLVFFSAFRELGGWPIAESAEWNRLGKHGSAWRSLANRLLDPGAQPGALTLESVEGELRALREKAKGGGKKLIPIAVLLVVVGGVGVVVATPVGKPVLTWIESLFGGNGTGRTDDADFDRGAVRDDLWKPWCDEMRWYEAVLDELGGERGELEKDPFIVERFLAIDEDFDAVDPRVFADKSMKLTDLARSANMPDRLLTEAGFSKAKIGLATLRTARQALGGDAPEDGWPAHRAIAELARRADSLGWQSTADLLDDLITDLKKFTGQSPPSARRASRNADTILELVGRTALIEGLNKKLAMIEGAMPVLAGSGDPVLGRFGELVASLDGQIDGRDLDRLDALDLRLDDVAALAGDLSDAIADQRFAGHLPARLIERLGPASDPSALTEETLTRHLVLIQTWQSEPIEPVVLADARETWALYGRIRDAEQRLVGLGRVDPARLGARLGQIGEEVGAIDDERVRVMDLPLQTIHEQQSINDAMARLDGRMDGVFERLGQIDTENTLRASNIAAFVQGVRAESSISRYSSDEVDAAWTTQRDILLAAYEVDEDAESLRNEVGELRAALTAIEGLFQGEPVIGKAPTGFDAVVLKELVGQRRLQGIAWVVDRLGFADGSATNAALLDETVSEAEQHDRWVEQVGATVVAMHAIEVRIEGGEPLDGATGGTILSDFDALDADELTQVVQKFVDRVTGLRVIARQSDPQALMTIAKKAGDVPAQMAAWRRLVTLEDWPATTSDLGQLASAMTRVRASVSILADASLAERLAGEVALDGARAWKGLVESAQTDDLVRSALLAGKSFDPALVELSPRSRYNELVSSLIGTIDPNDEQAAREQLDSFVKQVNAIDGLELSDGATKWAEQLATVALSSGSTGGGVEQLRRLGPGSKGWSIESGSDMLRVTYSSPTTGQSITFVRLDATQDGELTEPVYLATTEVSVELFDSVVRDNGGYDKIPPVDGRPLGGLASKRGAGPIAWSWDGNGLFVERYWLARQDDASGHYVIASTLAVEPPSPQSPMTYLKPEMASGVASLIGCRLPRAAEWEAALDLEESTGGNRRWNLRDQTFETQRNYMEVEFKQFVPREGEVWPDFGSYTWSRNTEGELVSNSKVLATVDLSVNDGVLWYMPVGGGGAETGVTFKHLVGNVAELVGETGQYGVMGASAISAPEVSYQTERGFKRTRLADTGFRLAFDARGTSADETLAQALERLLGKRVFVLADPGGSG